MVGSTRGSVVPCKLSNVYQSQQVMQGTLVEANSRQAMAAELLQSPGLLEGEMRNQDNFRGLQTWDTDQEESSATSAEEHSLGKGTFVFFN